MFQYFANIIFSPMHWLWTNIINRPIYGVRVWQIAVVMICISVFYRIFVFPTVGGTHFGVSVPRADTGISSVGSKVEHYSKLVKKNNTNGKGY